MKNPRLLTVDNTVADAIEVTLLGTYRTSFILSSTGKLIGVVGEGDILNAYRKGVLLTSQVSVIMNKNPVFRDKLLTQDDFVEIWKSTGIESIPIVDSLGRVLEIQNLRDFFGSE